MLKVLVLICTSIVLIGADCPLSDDDCAARNVALDLTFLIDGSDSISEANFVRVKEWILKAVNRFEPAERPAENKIQVTVVQYSERFATELNSEVVQTSSDEISASVLGINQMKEGTKTYGGLSYVTDRLNLREAAYKVLITMTDGRENDNRNTTAVEIAKGYFDLMAGVGVGKDIDWADLLNDLTKGVGPFTIDDFLTLDNITGNITDAVKPVCVGVDAKCSTATDSSVSLDLSVCVYGGDDFSTVSSILSTYQASITPTGTGTSIITNQLRNGTLEFTGLDPFTSYTITIADPAARKYILHVPNAISCPTKGRIELEASCVNSTDDFLAVSYSGKPSGQVDYIKDFYIEISPSDAVISQVTKANGDEALVMFTGLNPNTSYSVNIAAVANQSNFVVINGSTTCPTRVIPTCGEKTLGLTFLIDGSDSIEIREYTEFIEWMLTVIDAFKPQERDSDIRVDMVQYSSTFRTELSGLYVSDSSNEIRNQSLAVVSGQFRSGTRPYSALQFVMDNVPVQTNDGSYRVLVTITDANSIETRDLSIVNTARASFPSMVLFQNRDAEDSRQEVIDDLTYNSVPAFVGNTSALSSIAQTILNQIHEDCVIFNATCGLSSDNSVTVSYSYRIYPVTRDVSYYLQDLIVSITPTGTADNRLVRNLDQLTSTFTGLSPNTNYNLAVTGTKVPNRYFALEPTSVTCATKARIQVTVACEPSYSDTALTVSYSTVPEALATDTTLIQNYRIIISHQNGTEVASLTKATTEQRTASFSGLTANTEYTISVTIGEAAGAEVVVIPGSVTCVTAERVNLNVQCDASTDSSIAVSYSTDPSSVGSNSSYFQSFVISITPSGTSQNPVTNAVGSAMTATFSGLQPSTDYAITANVVKANGAVFEVDARSVTCRTNDLVLLSAACLSGNDSSLTVSYGIAPANYADITGFRVDMSLNGVVQETLMKSADDLMASFYGLLHSTRYSFAITALLASGSTAVLRPNPITAECVTDYRECTEIPINLVFLIDGSDSVTESQFSEMKDNILEIVDALNPSTLKNKPLIDVFQYSTNTRSELSDAVIQNSADEIRGVVGSIATIQEGSRPYTGLRYVNDRVTNEMAFKIFVLMSDGLGREPADQSVIDTARTKFDLMIAVAVGQDADVGQLRAFSDVGNPVASKGFWFSRSAVEQIRNASCEEDNIQFVVETVATKDTVNVTFYPIPIGVGMNSSLVDNYTVVISSNGMVVRSVVVDSDVRDVSFPGLTMGTDYTVSVTGTKISGADVFIDEATVTTTTKPCYQPVVRCESTTEDTISVNYTVSPDGLDSSTADGYTLVITPTGTAENTVRKTFDESTATFSGLSPYTEYLVTVSIDKSSDANVDVETGSVSCTTKVPIRPEVTCTSMTGDSVEVTYSVPGAGDTSSIITGYTVSRGSETVNRAYGQNTAAFGNLLQCMDYNITVDVDIDPSVREYVILQSGSIVCRTGEQPSSPNIVISPDNADNIGITITPLSCVNNYVIIYDRTDCSGSYCTVYTTTETSYTIPDRDATSNYSITVYGNYPVSGLTAGTTESVSAVTPTSCTTPQPTTAVPVAAPQCPDSLLPATIVFGVLLGIALLVIIVLGVAVAKK